MVGHNRPLCFVLMPGEEYDGQGLGLLLRVIVDRIDAPFADKSYNADAIRMETLPNKISQIIYVNYLYYPCLEITQVLRHLFAKNMLS